MMNEVDNILNGYHFLALFDMAEFAGYNVYPNNKKVTKAKLLPFMEKNFFTSKRVKASYKRLNEVERAVLNQLLLLGGTASTNQLRRMLLTSGVCTREESPPDAKDHYTGAFQGPGYYGIPPRLNSTVFENVIACLTRFGLVFSLFGNPSNLIYKVQFQPLDTVFVPKAIMAHLPEPEPEADKMAADWTLGKVRRGAPDVMLRDLYIYWAYIRKNQPSLTKAGYMRKRALKEINETLLIPDKGLKDVKREDQAERLFMLRRLLTMLELIKVDHARPLSDGIDPREIPKFWDESIATQLGKCLEAWGAASDPLKKSMRRSSYGRENFPRAKRVILDVLKGLPSETWFNLDYVYEKILVRDINFLFPYHAAMNARIHSRTRSSVYGMRSYDDERAQIKDYEKKEIAFTRECLSGFLTDIDIVESGCEPDEDNADSWSVFRISRTGKVVLARYPCSTHGEENVEEEEIQEDEGRFIVQPDFQLLALGAVKLSTLARLDLFADRERAGESAFEYRLSRESIYRAESIGMDLSEIMDLLTRIHGARIPDNVLHTLKEWSAQRERIVFRTGVSLIQTETPGLMEKLLKATKKNDIPGRRISPDLALIRKDDSKEISSLLVEKEIFPVLSSPRLNSADNSVIIDEKGWIAPASGATSLYLPTRLSKVADRISENRWRVTAASVKRVGGTRNKIRQLLKELSQLNREALPSKLVERIKAWGSYYGEAAEDTLTLIEFSSQTVLNELLAKPELSRDLKPFPAGSRPLAAVSPKKLTKVKKFLIRLGIGLSKGF